MDCLINRRSVARPRNQLALTFRRLQPRPHGLLDFPNGLLRGRAEGGAEAEVGDIRHEATVLLAVEDLDVVVLHDITALTGFLAITSASFPTTSPAPAPPGRAPPA